jgi:DNA-binding response OmpR family regulator
MPTTRKILIVDDEADICYFLNNTLSRKGFTTSFSHTLQEAEQQLALYRPDIILLDNHLPDGRGVDFAHKVSQQYPQLKIIMITAHDSPQDRARAYNNGVSLFLAKPFTIGEVSKAVELLMGSE